MEWLSLGGVSHKAPYIANKILETYNNKKCNIMIHNHGYENDSTMKGYSLQCLILTNGGLKLAAQNLEQLAG